VRSTAGLARAMVAALEREPVRYGVVGLSGVVVNTGVLALLASAGLPLGLASALAVETAINSNFLLNACWTFDGRADRGVSFGRYARFHLAAGIAGAANVMALLLLVRWARLPLAVANGCGIAAGVAVNWAVNSRWTWSRSRSAGRGRPAVAGG
jgi:dolichol-phosphate mannosyltransferase